MLNVGAPEIGVLLVVGLALLGPDRLPGVVRDGARSYRKFRAGIDGMTSQLREEAGLDVEDLRSMHPRRMFADLVQSDEESEANAQLSAHPVAADQRSVDVEHVR